MDALHVLQTTRTVRRRLDLHRPVEPHLVLSCVEVALQAPNGGNRQAWHWLIVTDAEQRRRIGEVYRHAAEAYLATCAPENSLPSQMNGVRYLAEHLAEVPVLVIACLDVGDPLPSGSQAALWGSILPAAWSYMLAARAHGLATAWTSVHLRREHEIAEILGLPPHIRQAAMIPTAYPLDGDDFRPGHRRPVGAVVHFDRFTDDPAGATPRGA